jgi:hypothetical protein
MRVFSALNDSPRGEISIKAKTTNHEWLTYAAVQRLYQSASPGKTESAQVTDAPYDAADVSSETFGAVKECRDDCVNRQRGAEGD